MAGSMILATSCSKKPVACINTSKTTYEAGDVVALQNCSENAKSYTWTMPDGKSNTSTSPLYTIPSTQADGSITFSLKATGGSLYAKNATTTKTVSVYTPKGSVVFWHYGSSSTSCNWSVTLSGTTKYVTSATYYTPSCGDAGCATYYDLPVGTYTYSAYDYISGYTDNGTVYIYSDYCSSIDVY